MDITDRIRKKQTGTDRNRQDYISDIEIYCIIKKFIYQIGNQEVKENPTEKKRDGRRRKKKKKTSKTAQDRGQKMFDFCTLKCANLFSIIQFLSVVKTF